MKKLKNILLDIFIGFSFLLSVFLNWYYQNDFFILAWLMIFGPLGLWFFSSFLLYLVLKFKKK